MSKGILRLINMYAESTSYIYVEYFKVYKRLKGNVLPYGLPLKACRHSGVVLNANICAGMKSPADLKHDTLPVKCMLTHRHYFFYMPWWRRTSDFNIATLPAFIDYFLPVKHMSTHRRDCLYGIVEMRRCLK